MKKPYQIESQRAVKRLEEDGRGGESDGPDGVADGRDGRLAAQGGGALIPSTCAL